MLENFKALSNKYPSEKMYLKDGPMTYLQDLQKQYENLSKINKPKVGQVVKTLAVLLKH